MSEGASNTCATWCDALQPSQIGAKNIRMLTNRFIRDERCLPRPNENKMSDGHRERASLRI